MRVEFKDEEKSVSLTLSPEEYQLMVECLYEAKAGSDPGTAMNEFVEKVEAAYNVAVEDLG